jgi:hypothetical protein
MTLLWHIAAGGTAEERLNAIGAVLEPEADLILAQCEA